MSTSYNLGVGVTGSSHREVLHSIYKMNIRQYVVSVRLISQALKSGTLQRYTISDNYCVANKVYFYLMHLLCVLYTSGTLVLESTH